MVCTSFLNLADLRLLLTILFITTWSHGITQTLGGNSVFNFLKLPNTPRLTALGGVNISAASNDVGLASNNPGLLKKEMHTQLNTVFNNFYAGINSYHLSFAYSQEKLKTNFAWGLSFFNNPGLLNARPTSFEAAEILTPPKAVSRGVLGNFKKLKTEFPPSV